MTLEATMVMLDNSAFSINGDYLPTRWESQVDAASILMQAKIQANGQSSVGLGLMAGKHVQILCTPTQDANKASSYLWNIKLGGQLKLSQALQTAALALKHRLNTSQKQRIVCFIGSCLRESIDELKLLGKKLKKNSISVDLVVFGDLSTIQKQKVQKFLQAIQFEQNSNILYIDPAFGYLSDKLISSKIISKDQDPEHNQAGQPDMDPQLLQAIQQSKKEAEKQRERQRQRQQQTGVQNILPAQQNVSPQAASDGMMPRATKPQKVQPTQIPASLINQVNNKPQIQINQNENLKAPQFTIQKVIQPQRPEQIQDNQDQDQQALLKRAQQLSLQQADKEYAQDDKKKDKKNNFTEKHTMASQTQDMTISSRHPPQSITSGVEMSEVFRSHKHTGNENFMKQFQQLQQDEDEQKPLDDKKNKTQKHQQNKKQPQ